MKAGKIDDFQENQLVMVIKAWQRVRLHCKTCFATEVEQVRQDVTVLHFSGGQASNSQCCPSFVSYHEIWRTAPRILPKLGQKLRGHKWGTVARPDFPGKIWIIQ